MRRHSARPLQRRAASAASAAINAPRYALLFQQALMGYCTGDLDPERVSLAPAAT